MNVWKGFVIVTSGYFLAEEWGLLQTKSPISLSYSDSSI